MVYVGRTIVEVAGLVLVTTLIKAVGPTSDLTVVVVRLVVVFMGPGIVVVDVVVDIDVTMRVEVTGSAVISLLAGKDLVTVKVTSAVPVRDDAFVTTKVAVWAVCLASIICVAVIVPIVEFFGPRGIAVDVVTNSVAAEESVIVVARIALGGRRLRFSFVAWRQLKVVVTLVVFVLVEVVMDVMTLVCPDTVFVPPLPAVNVIVEVTLDVRGIEVFRLAAVVNWVDVIVEEAVINSVLVRVSSIVVVEGATVVV